jgi:hypothetical protein
MIRDAFVDCLVAILGWCLIELTQWALRATVRRRGGQ